MPGTAIKYSVAPVLKTERLILRPNRREDFKAFAGMLMSERSKYMDGPYTERASWDAFMGDVGHWPIFGFGAWAIEVAATGAHAGQVGLGHPPHFPEIELGWMLFEDFEGQGYAFEAAQRVLAFAFNELGLETIVSYVDPDNRGSRRLAERLGGIEDPDAKRPDPCVVYRHSPKHGA